MSGDDGIEVRLRSYGTVCQDCARLKAQGVAHVEGKALLCNGVIHLYTEPGPEIPAATPICEGRHG